MSEATVRPHSTQRRAAIALNWHQELLERVPIP